MKKGVHVPSKVMKEAYKIATVALRSCYKKHGIIAGLNHYSDYWARDSFFSCIGALEIGDKKIVKKNLELFLKYTRKDGQVPLRVGAYNQVKKHIKMLLGIKQEKKLGVRYRNDANRHFPIDTNSLLLVAAHYYIKNTKDYQFGKKHYEKFKKILVRNFQSDSNYNLLLENHPHSTWEDSLNFNGESIYPNVCHCAAVRAIAEIARLLKKKKESTYFQELHTKVKNMINSKFWNGKFYSNYLLMGKKLKVFNTAGNLLSIHWKIASKQQAKSIEKEIKKCGINKYVPSLTNFPKYPYKFIFYPLFLLGLYDYHNYGMCWLWLGAEDVIVKFKLKMKKDAYKILEKISETIIKYNNVYEVYEKDGTPVKRWFYSSEVPFAWSSSLFIKAYHTLFDKKRKIIY